MSAMNYTPLHLEILIHYHSVVDPFPRENSVIIEYRAHLIRDGIVAPEARDKASFAITERGRCFIEMLCSTPLPIKKDIWADPRS
jgi:hypothetical protein